MKKFVIVLLCLSFVFAESLWRGEKNGIFDDHRAKNIGDSITIIVLETVSSKHKDDNAINNSSQVSIGPGTGYANFLSSQTAFPNASAFKANGEKTSEGELKAEVTVKVKSVQPNGELVVYGNKETNINGDKQMIEISGIVRPENIMADNRVYSTFLADSKINYTTDGEAKNATEPGLITKLFNTVF